MIRLPMMSKWADLHRLQDQRTRELYTTHGRLAWHHAVHMREVEHVGSEQSKFPR